MHIIVYIKQTFDTEAQIAVDSNGKIDSNGVHFVVNPYDEYAIEEGVRLKEKFGGDVTVITMGGSRAQDALRTALAMGADKAVLIDDSALEKTDEWVTANVLTQAVASLPYDVIFTGRMAIDDGSGQVGVRVAENLHIPSVTNAVKIEINEKSAVVTQEIDGGTASLEVSLPAVFTAQKGLNDPRYPSVAGMMKAKRKELKKISLTDLGLEKEKLVAKMTVGKYAVSAARQAGKKLQGSSAQQVAELVNLLKTEVKAF
ncbi:MAG: electron transfer flavoprotein subunit beta/FixA family protein [Veillonellales bacterium]